ncbi:MAG TPA: alternative ribosome rescue aminoacyl-tRNA hydrolase ArfB [Bacteroidota bacterium]|nr:alternative ribosome rescue aminoacyl-tRNA hydrolase ArfB [Bacteroidota bacterium]
METIVIGDKIRIPFSDLRFRFSRSGGPGGQNVNKVATRVELIFDVTSSSFDRETKETLLRKLRSKLDSEGRLRVVSQGSRSQWKNREDAVERFISLLSSAVTKAKKRTPTGATKSAQEERISRKKGRSKLKKTRKIDLNRELY